MGDDRRIVVGVDGSEGSREALRWAGGQAALTGAQLQVMIAWELPVTFALPVGFDDRIDLGESAGRTLDETIHAVFGPDPAVPVRPVVVRGFAGRALVQAAAQAELLVVGSRGHNFVAGAMLGSVSYYCVQRAPCPVVVIRDPG
jgi:nucleotide-binding universal stress UspA family protein